MTVPTLPPTAAEIDPLAGWSLGISVRTDPYEGLQCTEVPRGEGVTRS